MAKNKIKNKNILKSDDYDVDMERWFSKLKRDKKSRLIERIRYMWNEIDENKKVQEQLEHRIINLQNKLSDNLDVFKDIETKQLEQEMTIQQLRKKLKKD